MPTSIRSEQPADHAAIAAVQRAAFARDAEANLVSALRHDGLMLVSLVALHGEIIIGHVMFSTLRVEVSGRELVAATLAPLAVVPDFQRRGYGSALVRAGIEVLRAKGCHAIIVLGDPDYYARFGFSASLTRNLTAPFRGPAFMGLELSAGALTGHIGSVTYPPPFGLVA
jgi:putative acetyltransferase